MGRVEHRDPTTLAVLLTVGDQFARRQSREKHNTSTRRLPPILPSSRSGKPGETTLLMHHRSNRAAIYCSLTRETRPHSLFEMGGSPVHLCYQEGSRRAELGGLQDRVARHDMGWLGRSTIVSPSAHRPSTEELGLHDGKPGPACVNRIGRLARSCTWRRGSCPGPSAPGT